MARIDEVISTLWVIVLAGFGLLLARWGFSLFFPN